MPLMEKIGDTMRKFINSIQCLKKTTLKRGTGVSGKEEEHIQEGQGN